MCKVKNLLLTLNKLKILGQIFFKKNCKQRYVIPLTKRYDNFQFDLLPILLRYRVRIEKRQYKNVVAVPIVARIVARVLLKTNGS